MALAIARAKLISKTEKPIFLKNMKNRLTLGLLTNAIGRLSLGPILSYKQISAIVPVTKLGPETLVLAVHFLKYRCLIH